jgi:hypothetical protein
MMKSTLHNPKIILRPIRNLTLDLRVQKQKYLYEYLRSKAAHQPRPPVKKINERTSVVKLFRR